MQITPPIEQQKLLRTNSENLYSDLIELLSQFAGYVKEFGHDICVTRYSETTKARFLDFPRERQERIFADFKKYCDFIYSATASTKPIFDEASILKYFLKSNDWSTCDEIFEYVNNDICIEVYNLESVQIYRNFNFFDMMSHSLEDILFLPWWELFDRSEDISKKVMATGFAVLSGAHVRPLYRPIDNHTVKEINSPKLYSAQIEVLLYAPMFDSNKQVYGIIHFFRVHNIRPLTFTLLH